MTRPGTGDRAQSSAGRPRGKSENLTNVANRLASPMYVSDRAMPPEKDTIRAIETLLQITHIGSKPEEAYVMDSIADDGLVTDPDFSPGPSSLYPDPSLPPATAIMSVIWRRVSGTLYLPTARTPKLLQGIINNNHFLGALAAVAVKQDLLLELIISDDHAHQGVYTFQFYKHGCWHQVVVDNFLPCMDDEDRLAFACSGNVGELWPSFIEKAYAKVHGSYWALEGGAVHEALVDMTGGVPHKINLTKNEEHIADAESGALWNQICSYLKGGSVVACQGRTKDTSRDPATPEGLLYNFVYNILDAREVDSKTRLLRLHCPWSEGIWTGAWSAGSSEWELPALKPAMPLFAATLADEATFWMSYEDFIAFFNRVYISRLFPPTWHQLTLQCGWQGPSAGGPYYMQLAQHDNECVMGMSSTWCCNPQFRVTTVRKMCEIVIALSHQDPLLVHRRHVAKNQRKRMIGLQILQVPISSLGRRWEVRPSELLVEVPLSAGREVTASFKAQPDMAYIIVPYAGRAGDEGAFVLRTFSSSPLEVEQLPSPLSLVLGGRWVGYLAGGARQHASFGSNPQYMISSQHKTQAVLSVVRLDTKYAILKPSFHPDQCVGFTLVEPEKGSEGLGRRNAVHKESEVHAETGFNSMEEAVLLVNLEPETPYVVVPSLAAPGLEAPFELRIMSTVPVELVPLPEVKSNVVIGEWREETSGGCDLHPVWKKNPRILFCLARPARARISLSKLFKSGKTSVDDMIGFYVLKASKPNGDIKGDVRKAVLTETTFVLTPEISAEYDLQGGVPYVIMPCTYSPGRFGKYQVSVSCSEEFDLTELARPDAH